jgi:hypothetical protein
MGNRNLAGPQDFDGVWGLSDWNQQRRQRFDESIIKAADALVNAAMEITSAAEAEELSNKVNFYARQLKKISKAMP